MIVIVGLSRDEHSNIKPHYHIFSAAYAKDYAILYLQDRKCILHTEYNLRISSMQSSHQRLNNSLTVILYSNEAVLSRNQCEE